MKTWQEAARGIEPWPGARALIHIDGVPHPQAPSFLVLAPVRSMFQSMADKVLGWHVSDPLRVTQTTTKVNPHEVVVDLADPDTRAAFDRRLALRLGAPAEAVDRGVWAGFDTYLQTWVIYAGLNCTQDSYAWDWWAILPHTTHADMGPLLARALAWRSVP